MAEDPGALLIRIDATIGLLQSQLRQAERSVASFQKNADGSLAKVDRRFDLLGRSAGKLKSVLTGFGAGAISGFVASLGIGALASAAKNALDYAGGLGEAAQAAGVGTKFLQEFRFAAEQNAASVEQADNALARFSATLGKARDGQKSSAAAFSDLGVALSDSSGQAKSTEQVYRDVADAIARIPDPAQQASAAQAIFGKGFRDILPLLKQGSAGFNQLAADAQTLGIVLSDDLIAQADQASDRLQAFKRVLEAKLAGVVAENAASITYFSEQLLNFGASAIKAASDYLQFRNQIARTDQISRQNRGTQSLGGIPGLFEVKRNTRRPLPKGGRGGGRFDPTGSFSRTADAIPATAQAAADLADTIESGSSSGRVRSGGGARRLPAAIRETQKAAEDALPSIADLNATFRELSDQLNDGPPKGSRLYDSLGIDATGDQEAILAEIEARRETVFRDRLDQEDEIRRVGEANIRDLSGLYEDLFTGGISSVWDSFKRIGIQAISDVLAQLTANAFGGGGGGGLLGGLFGGGGGAGGGLGGILGSVLTGTPFGGGRATGGPVRAGTAYLVGERGPEIFQPRIGGNIIPNSAIGAGSAPQINLYFDGQPTAETVAAIDQRLRLAAPGIVAAAETRTIRTLDRKRL